MLTTTNSNFIVARKKKVMVASLLRRKIFLDEFMGSLRKLSYDNKHLYFLINDPKFNESEFDLSFDNFKTVSIDRIDFKTMDDVRKGGIRRKIYYLLAVLRNIVLVKFYFSDDDYLFFVDSDIMLKENALETLLSLDKDFVSCNICNDYGVGKYTNALVKRGNGWKHLSTGDVKGLTKCDLTGSAFLISKKLLTNYPLYDWNSMGEDTGFCERVSKDFEIFTYPGLAEHHMRRIDK